MTAPTERPVALPRAPPWAPVPPSTARWDSRPEADRVRQHDLAVGERERVGALPAKALGVDQQADPTTRPTRKPEKLVEGIRVVAAGDALFAPSIMRRLVESSSAGVRARPRPTERWRRSPDASARSSSSSRAGCPTRRSLRSSP